jgi:multimeric flavodoxin WrbA
MIGDRKHHIAQRKREGTIMRVVGISGSPRKGGNTECLVNECLNEFESDGWIVAKHYLSEKIIGPCAGCEICVGKGICAIGDDDAVAIFGDLMSCDAVIIGSPVYYRNVSSQLKAVFDRTFAYGHGILEGKPGGAIAVGRGEGAGQATTLMIIYNYMLSCGGLPVPGELNGLSAKADRPGDISLQEKRLSQARTLAQNIMKYAAKLSRP